MTGTELKTFTENVLDGVTIDDDLFYQLLNIAKTKLEEAKVWQYLKKLDSSNTASTGGSYTLPTDFAHDYKVLVGSSTEYSPVEFEEQHLYTNSSYRYYIDHGQNKLFLLGTVQSNPLYFYYKRFTPDIEAGTSPVFPERFHPLLGFFVASYYQGGIDSDDVFARMSPVNKIAALELQRAMEQWDNQLKNKSQGGRIGVANSQPTVNLGDM